MLLFCLAARCQDTPKPAPVPSLQGLHFDAALAKKDLLVIAAKPHPFGSPRQEEIAQHLAQRIQSTGFEPYIQKFTVKTPDPQLRLQPAKKFLPRTVTGRNVWAKTSVPKGSCVVLVGSHYDSKDMDGLSFVGANDGGSSSVVLLQMLEPLQKLTSPKGCAVWGIWFDGEESVLSQWDDADALDLDTVPDNTYGSRHVAASLHTCGKELCLPEELGGHPVRALVLMDLVGAPHVRFTKDANSDPTLRALFADTAKQMGLSQHVSTGLALAIGDDHIPFRDRGLPVINLIDFEHLEVWHKDGDVPSYVDAQSLEITWRLATALTARIATGN